MALQGHNELTLKYMGKINNYHITMIYKKLRAVFIFTSSFYCLCAISGQTRPHNFEYMVFTTTEICGLQHFWCEANKSDYLFLNYINYALLSSSMTMIAAENYSFVLMLVYDSYFKYNVANP